MPHKTIYHLIVLHFLSNHTKSTLQNLNQYHHIGPWENGLIFTLKNVSINWSFSALTLKMCLLRLAFLVSSIFMQKTVIYKEFKPWMMNEKTTEGWDDNFACLYITTSEDAHWYMLGHELSSTLNDFFLWFTAASLMIQTPEVLRSSQVCFTQHTHPKFALVKITHNTHRLHESTQYCHIGLKKLLLQIELWNVSV